MCVRKPIIRTENTQKLRLIGQVHIKEKSDMNKISNIYSITSNKGRVSNKRYSLISAIPLTLRPEQAPTSNKCFLLISARPHSAAPIRSLTTI